jgi:hypothetical protein
MRYFVAMLFAVIGLALAALFVSTPVANWVVSHQSFDSPDAADNLHMATFILSNIGGLILGWLVGWVAAGAGGADRQPG